MAAQIYQGAELFVDDLDLTGDINTLGLDYGAETVENTRMDDDTRVVAGSLLTVGFSNEGYWREPVDDALFNETGQADVPVTIAPEGDAAGNLAFFFPALQTEYSPGGSVGDQLAFSVSGSGTGKLVRGRMAFPKAARTSSANSAVRNLGSVGADQRLYASLHVLAASGTNPTLDVVIKGDTDTTFSDADETTHLTFTQATGKTSEIISSAGAISDTHFRAEATIGGTGPSFTFLVAIGIG
jgi:hypothetical protein